MSLDEEIERLSTCQYIEHQKAAFDRASLIGARDSARAKLEGRQKTLDRLPAGSDLRARVEADIVDLQNRIAGYEAEMAAGTPDFSDKETRENLIARVARHYGWKRKELARQLKVPYTFQSGWIRHRWEGRFKRHSDQVERIEVRLCELAKNIISTAANVPKTHPRANKNVTSKASFRRKRDPKRRI